MACHSGWLTWSGPSSFGWPFKPAPDLRASLSETRLHVLDGWSYSREILLKAGLSCWSCARGLYLQTLKHISKNLLNTYLYILISKYFIHSLCMYVQTSHCILFRYLLFGVTGFPCLRTKEKGVRPPVRKSSMDRLWNRICTGELGWDLSLNS